MHEKDNYLKTAELSTEQNCNMIDGVPNNTPDVYKRQIFDALYAGRTFALHGIGR